MNEKLIGKMKALKLVLIVLLAFAVVSFVTSCISLFPTFGNMSEYGEIMVIVSSIILALMLVAMLFGIVAKIVLIRSASKVANGAPVSKGCVAISILLIIFNVISALFSFLSLGGVGATALNQARIWIQIIACVAEIVTVILYLGTAKKLSSDK